MTPKINDKLIYGLEGPCKVTDTTKREFQGKNQKYLVLTPIFNEKVNIFVPLFNEELFNRMRPIVSKKVIMSNIVDIPTRECKWPENDEERKTFILDTIINGKARDIVRLIKTLYLQEEKQRKSLKKLHLADERNFKELEKVLFGIFAASFNITPEEVPAKIKELLKKK